MYDDPVVGSGCKAVPLTGAVGIFDAAQCFSPGLEATWTQDGARMQSDPVTAVQPSYGVNFGPAPVFDIEVPVLVLGAGACGCTAALAAAGAGARVLIVERDGLPRGNTALSGGQIPAAGTRLQHEAGIDDTPDLLAEDLITKAKGLNDGQLARHIAGQSARTVDWLAETHGIPLACITDFVYPGHSRPHMHATPSRFGAELLDALLAAVQRSEADLVTGFHVHTLHVGRDQQVVGVSGTRPDGVEEHVGCEALILATNGYGGSRALLERHAPEIAQAPYLGHAGNQGCAVIWGEALGAALKDLGAFQGHGAVCTPHMVQLGWPVFTEGGIQVDASGRRFSNENAGYSEQALNVLRQPGCIAWAIWDNRCEAIAEQMHSHKLAHKQGAIRRAADVSALSDIIGCDPTVLEATLASVRAAQRGEVSCPWGRRFSDKPALAPPYWTARSTGALFHTQGGLEVDASARVLRSDGQPFPNLFAGGGAARGLSGPKDWGYLSGSGLMSAVNLGRIAGEAAARQTAS